MPSKTGSINTYVISIEHVISAAVVYVATYTALLSILLRSSMYTINKYRDKILPCRTQLVTLKKYDVVQPHLIQNVWVM